MAKKHPMSESARKYLQEISENRKSPAGLVSQVPKEVVTVSRGCRNIAPCRCSKCRGQSKGNNVDKNGKVYCDRCYVRYMDECAEQARRSGS